MFVNNSVSNLLIRIQSLGFPLLQVAGGSILGKIAFETFKRIHLDGSKISHKIIIGSLLAASALTLGSLITVSAVAGFAISYIRNKQQYRSHGINSLLAPQKDFQPIYIYSQQSIEIKSREEAKEFVQTIAKQVNEEHKISRLELNLFQEDFSPSSWGEILYLFREQNVQVRARSTDDKVCILPLIEREETNGNEIIRTYRNGVIEIDQGMHIPGVVLSQWHGRRILSSVVEEGQFINFGLSKGTITNQQTKGVIYRGPSFFINIPQRNSGIMLINDQYVLLKKISLENSFNDDYEKSDEDLFDHLGSHLVGELPYFSYDDFEGFLLKDDHCEKLIASLKAHNRLHGLDTMCFLSILKVIDAKGLVVDWSDELSKNGCLIKALWEGKIDKAGELLAEYETTRDLSPLEVIYVEIVKGRKVDMRLAGLTHTEKQIIYQITKNIVRRKAE